MAGREGMAALGKGDLRSITPTVIVGGEELERSLLRLAASVDDPRAGIHGPGSMAWRYNRESWNFIGGGRAALLQLAHPYVAHAIDQHSTTRADVRGRFRRTFASIFAMTFGDLPSALRAARRVHAVHRRITGILDEDVGVLARGHAYRANDQDALIWVHLTLVDTVLEVRRLAFGAPPAAEVRAYYDETRRFAALFGIPERALPPDAEAMAGFLRQQIDDGAVAVGRPAREIARHLLLPPSAALAAPFALYRRITSALLPPALRASFGLPDGPLDRAVAAAALRSLGALWPRLPRQLRFLPAYLEAEARVGGRAAGPLGRAADRLAMTGFGVWPRPSR
jgi:uncharacterized protein (DUF2236 family)